MLEKNKLHNRYLFGWGVVCGLEVICSPCAGQVTVTSGYALSPCGEDVVVCSNDTVNVCDLIQQCQVQQRQSWNCDPPSTGNTGGDRGYTEEWVLAIRYQERPSKGVMPLKNSSSSCSRCGGSGAGCSGGSSCTCGSQSSTTNGYKTASKTTSPQCEPTVICEGYVYEVYKAQPFSGSRRGALLTRVIQCMGDFTTISSALSLNNINSGVANNVQQLADWLRALKSSLQNLLETLPIYDCQLAAQLGNISIPNTSARTANATIADFAAPANQILDVAGSILSFCVCSALLPPCPDAVDDPRIPLATITVSTEDCQLLQVCNLDTRQFVPTVPNLLYWLSPVLQLVLNGVHGAIGELCCTPFSSDLIDTSQNRLSATNLTFQPTSNINAASQLLAQVFANRGRTIDTRLLALGALGVKDGQGKAVLSDLELNNPAAFLVLNQLVQPVLNALLPEQVLRTFSATSPAGSEGTAGTPAPSETAAASAQDEQLSKLQTEVSALQETLKQQQEIIDQLQKRLNG